MDKYFWSSSKSHPLLCCSSLAFCLALLHVVEKIQNQQEPKPPSPQISPGQPIKKPETNHQPITKSHTTVNHLQYAPPPSKSVDQTDSFKPAYRTNGLSGYVPNPPVRNPLRISIPSSKHLKARSSQSAAEQLGVRSAPPIRSNGGTYHICVTDYYISLACFL